MDLIIAPSAHKALGGHRLSSLGKGNNLIKESGVCGAAEQP
jgi:hypothetical protein